MQQVQSLKTNKQTKNSMVVSEIFTCYTLPGCPGHFSAGDVAVSFLLNFCVGKETDSGNASFRQSTSLVVGRQARELCGHFKTETHFSQIFRQWSLSISKLLWGDVD